jgi:hypothetical protein
LLHFFLSREKSGKHKLTCLIKRVKILTAMLRQAQHDKEGETLQLAARFTVVKLIWAFEKVYYRKVRCRIKSGMTAERV